MIKPQPLTVYASYKGSTFILLKLDYVQIVFALFIQITVIFILSANVALLVCSCWMLVVIPKDIVTEFSLLNRDKTPDGRRKIFCEIVELYANAKQ